MNLTVRDVSRLLNVSEKTIYRWLKQRSLPGYRIQDQYRFNRAEILEWATERRLPVSPKVLGEEAEEEPSSARLLPALETGGIHYRVGGRDKDSVLRNVVKLLPLPEGTDRELLLGMLLAREHLGSTAVGQGIAIPHPRFPVILPPSPNTLSLCFLEEPVLFGALDGQPVGTLFVLVSSTVKNHLRLLSRLAMALQDSPLRDHLAKQAGREILMEAFTRIEGRLPGGT